MLYIAFGICRYVWLLCASYTYCRMMHGTYNYLKKNWITFQRKRLPPNLRQYPSDIPRESVENKGRAHSEQPA